MTSIRTIMQLALLFMLYSTAVQAQEELVHFETKELKQRYVHLLKTTRCLVCQNQSLADSSASLADDLRKEIEKMLREGKTDQQIIDFLVSRYGDFVLYDPPLKTSTLPLWLGPVTLVFVFLLTFILYLRKTRKETGENEVDRQKRMQAAQLLEIDNDEKK